MLTFDDKKVRISFCVLLTILLQSTETKEIIVKTFTSSKISQSNMYRSGPFQQRLNIIFPGKPILLK